ncbi:MAG: hypothetical protein OEW21_16235 [Betaproteobacteria bacterium]|nr:hypothetical protein [Betaproteobacteria bacterium]
MAAKDWFWIGKYLIVIVVALILGAVLGSLALFKSATLGTPRLTAGSLTQFIAHGGALALLWAMGQRLARQLRGIGGGSAMLSTIVLALVTLIVVGSAYVVLLAFIRPFLAAGIKPFVDWTFILGLIATAVWLAWALFENAEALIEAIGKAFGGRNREERSERSEPG